MNTIAMLLDQVNGSTMVMFFFGLAVDALPFCSRPCFILAPTVCAKLCFCILCLRMGLSTFQEFVGGEGIFLCFCVSRKQDCGHGPPPPKNVEGLILEYVDRKKGTIFFKLTTW